MWNEADNNELMRLIVMDDAAAFSELYRRFEKRLLLLAGHMVKNADAAQDIVQEVFLNLWKNRHKTNILNIENYLATAIKFLCLNYIKRGKIITISQLEHVPELANDENLENLFYSKYLMQLVQEETNKLPEQCRAIFQYRNIEGLSVKEIAVKMDLSPRTVENQLYIALGRLRKALKTISGFWSSLF